MTVLPWHRFSALEWNASFEKAPKIVRTVIKKKKKSLNSTIEYKKRCCEGFDFQEIHFKLIYKVYIEE